MATLTRAAAGTSAPGHVHPLRRDLQALRAFAVVAVVVYHVWPRALPGGFVGVDVFFVISGFLISGQLLAAPPTGPRSFVRFWGRRVLRLIPAVAVVIVATLAAAVLWMSIAEWKRTAGDAVGSMFYVENWRLIAESTNYLDQHRTPSPFQHFWSLSVEEQFYLGWPFVVALAAWLARRRRGARATTYAAVFGLVVAASLVASVVLTRTTPSTAYFSTFTRLWELALGGLLAAVNQGLLARLGVPTRVALLWAGLAGLVASVVLIHASTPYPGYAALLPTLAGAAVILAHDPAARWSPRGLMHSRVVQHLGDTSYALYLWHWPLIIVVPYALGHRSGWPEDLMIIALAVLAATASTWLLENPPRRLPALRLHTGRVFAMGAALSLVVVGASWAMTHHVDRLIAANQAQVQARIDQGDPCLGAGALVASHHCAADAGLLTTPEFAKEDYSVGITPGGCLNYPPFPSRLEHCEAGDTRHPARHIALLGNSQAGQWLPTLSYAGHQRHWQITTYLMGGCTLVLDDVSLPEPQGVTNADCRRLQQQQIDEIAAAHYDLVVVSSFVDIAEVTPADYVRTVRALSATGIPVLILHSTPAKLSGQEPADCVADHLDDPSPCAGPASEWRRDDPLADEAETAPTTGVQVLDLDDLFCPDTTCPSVIGRVIVYRDNVHMTSTYARTLAPFLSPYLKALMTHTAPPTGSAGSREPATL